MSMQQAARILPPKWNFSLAIMAIWLVGFLPLETAPVWIPAAQIHYHVSAVTMGELASAQFLAAAISAMFLAPLLGRLPLRGPMLAVMAGALAASLCTAALQPAFAVFCALRLADGLTSGMCVACAAILANRTPRPARSFGVMQFAQITANMIVFTASTRLVVAYGVTGVYGLLAAGILALIGLVFFHAGWPVAIVPKPATRAPRAKSSLRIVLSCLGTAVVYAGFVGMVTNASALGSRAGLGLAQVTVLLALSTPFSASGALLATVLAGRVSSAALVCAGAIGTASCGLALILGGFGFASLAAAMCGIIFFIFIGFPSIYAGIAKLDLTGRSAATAQAAQLMGPVFGPAVGAIIAVHSVTGLAAALTVAISGGITLACAAVWPVLTHEMALAPGEVAESVTSLPGII
jgi:MFS family permease